MKKFPWVIISILLIVMSLMMPFDFTGVVQAGAPKSNLEELINGADSIVVGTVVERSSYWNDERNGIYTSVVLSPEEMLKGTANQDSITVTLPGGEADGIGELVSGMPTFGQGERVGVLLKKLSKAQLPKAKVANLQLPEEQFEVYGGFRGKFTIKQEKVGNLTVTQFKERVSGVLQGRTFPDEEFDAPLSLATFPYSYAGYCWPGSSPVVNYRINENTADCSGEGAAVQNAAATWNAAGASFSFSYAGTTTATTDSYNGVNEIMWGNLGSGGTVGVTSTWYSGGTILECDMVLNDYYVWSTSASPVSGRYDVQTIALHELGHFLCLNDLYNAGDSAKVMYGYGSTGTTKRTLHADDIAGVKSIYPPFASKIAFITSVQTIAAGSVSNVLTIQTQDSSNNPVNVATKTISLSSTSGAGRFDTSASGLFNGIITSVTIPNGSSSASFYYKDTATGTPTITAASTGLTSGTQQETVNPATATTISIATSPMVGASVDANLSIQPVILVADQFSNPVSGVTVTASRGTGTGTLRGNLTATSAAGTGRATFTNLGYNKSGETFTIHFATGNLTSDSASLGPLTVGAATRVRVETAANGSGVVVGAQSLAVRSTLTVYGVTRDQYSNYVGNPANTAWSLTGKMGGVADSDLSATSGASVNMTGHLPGIAVIHATNGALTAGNSGNITVIADAIVFTSRRDGNWEIYVMNPDGSNQVRLTNNATIVCCPCPVFSPDLNKIAFVSDRDGNQEIYVMNLDGTNQTRLTNNTAYDDIPSWSPDGTKIAFSSDRDGLGYEIYIMNADGTSQTRMTNNIVYDGEPVWSPDGTKIAYDSNSEIYLMNSNGTGITRLTNNTVTDVCPSWSPDGTKIAFTSNPDGNYDIYVMDISGNNTVRLTTAASYDDCPVWSPDGTKIVFGSSRDGNPEIYSMNANGTNQLRLTNNTADDVWPDWAAILTAPEVTSGSATNVTTTAATLNGNLTSLGTASTANVSFEYGTTTGYGNATSVQVMNAKGTFNANATGLTPGTQYHFRAKADSGIHGIANGTDMTFTTGTTPPVVGTTSANSVTTTTATLNGNLTSLGTASTANVSFEYGTTTGYGNATSVQVMNAKGTFNANATGLTPGTQYHFRAKADSGIHGIANGTDMTFTTLTPPTVTSNPATGITTNTATLNGNLTSLGTATTANVSFEYGITTGYGSTTAVQTMNATGVFNASISGLSPGTLYHSRALGNGGVHGTGNSPDLTFSTLTPPSIVSWAASGITIYSATLNGNLTSLGTATGVDVSFEYGTTTAYGNTTTVQPMSVTGVFNITVSSLTPGTLYHFRAKANGGIHGAANGGDMTFTSATAPPVVSTTSAGAVTNVAATLNGNLTSLGTAQTANVSFEYGATTAYGNSTIIQTVNATGIFSANITGLLPSTIYHFRAKVDGGIHGMCNGTDLIFVTITSPVVTNGAVTNIGLYNATLNGNLITLGNATSANVSFEYGTTNSYGSATTIQVMNTTGSFSASITGLTDTMLYHFRSKVDGGILGIYSSPDSTFTTRPIKPLVTTLAASPCTMTTAKLNANLTDLGNATNVTASFDWGLTTSYGNTTAPSVMNSTGLFSANITTLPADTTYHFRANATGDGTTSGDDLTFTTLPTTPVIITGSATGITTNSATLNANLISKGIASNVNISFEWGTTEAYGNVTTPQVVNATGIYTATLTGLNPSTSYHFRANAVGNGTAFGNDTVFTTSAPALAGGGGGGGGGGGSSPIQYRIPNGTVVQGAINSEGKVLGTIVTCSEDKNITMTIPAYTTAKDESGHPLSILDIAKMEEPPPVPAGANFVGIPYEFGPSGATFNPPLSLTWQYNPVTIPVGTDEANLQVAVWDETKNEWVQVEAAVVDAVHHTVIVKLSHFSTYALMIKKPASFEYSKFNVFPGEATLQEGIAASFSITVSVTNTGGYTGNQTMVLKINDKETAKQEITINPGMSQNVTFQETVNDPGTYTVDVNGQTGQFIVKPRPAAFKVSGLALSAPEIVTGSNATASVIVTNTGGSPGKYILALTMDGTNLTSKELSINAGESKAVTFELSENKTGVHKVDINGLESQLVIKELPKEPEKSFDWRIIGVVLLLGLVGMFVFFLTKRKQPVSKAGDKPAK